MANTSYAVQQLIAEFTVKDEYGNPHHVQLWSDDDSAFGRLLKSFLRRPTNRGAIGRKFDVEVTAFWDPQFRV